LGINSSARMLSLKSMRSAARSKKILLASIARMRGAAAFGDGGFESL
jgi:hypothetical protein